MKKIFIIFVSLIAIMTFCTVCLVVLSFFSSPQVELKNINRNNSAPTHCSSYANVNNIPPPPSATLIAVGDIMLSRNVAAKIKKYNDVNYPFLQTTDYLQSGGILFGNLESPITPGPEVKTGSMTFHADPGVEAGLKNSGFTILSLANNHFPNYGAKGIENSLKYLDEVGIKYTGAGMNENEACAPAYVEANDLKFAFLAYNDTDVVPPSYGADAKSSGTCFMDIAKMMSQVEVEKTKVDFVIVSMHSGTEYTTKPNKRQVAFAHSAIDSGATMVIGHHPHVVQEAEIYNGKYIFYSLGNFVFDQMWSQATREGMTLKIKFIKSGVEKIDYQPILIEDYSQPTLLGGKEADEITEILNLK
jgi:poly-gamma-glutamate synthesis protein (capsule biosynthesis protein)